MCKVTVGSWKVNRQGVTRTRGGSRLAVGTRYVIMDGSQGAYVDGDGCRIWTPLWRSR